MIIQQPFRFKKRIPISRKKPKMCDRSLFTVAFKRLFFILLIFAALSLFGSFPISSAVAQSLALVKHSTSDPTKASPESDKQNIDSLVALMNDEQVRRLLIEELKAQVAREKLLSIENNEIGGIAGFIHSIKNRISYIRERIETLRTSEGVDIQ